MNRLLIMFGILSFMTFLGLFFSSSINVRSYDLMDKNIMYHNNKFVDNKQIIDSLFKEKYFQELLINNKFIKIEDELKKIKSIKDINIYLNNNYEIELSIVDRTAVAYIEKYNSFIDINGVVYKKKFNTDELLTVIGGTILDNEIPTITKVLLIFNEDNFFKNKLEKIWFENEELYMRIENLEFNIRLGDSKNIKDKLKMLKGFYAYQSKNLFKKKYKQVDLVYQNRLVAIKK